MICISSTLTLIVPKCAPVVFNAFLEYIVHFYCVVRIPASTCITSLIAIVTSCRLVHLSVGTPFDRVEKHSHILISDTRVENQVNTLPLGNHSQNHSAHGVGESVRVVRLHSMV